MRAALLGLALVLGACDASGGGDALALAVVSGDAQRGLAGQPLPNVVVVEATRGGAPAAGVALAVEASDGTAAPSVRTGADGRAALRWTLGDADRPTLRVAAEGVSATATAQRLPDADADRVVIGGPGTVRGVVVLADEGPARVVLRERSTTAREVLLLPLDGPATVVVFAADGPPTLRTVDWTAGPDRVEVALRPPLTVDVRVEIMEPPFEAHRAAALRDAEQMGAVWRGSGLGLTVGAVEVVDRTALAPTVTRPGPCPPTAEAVRSVVRYVTDIPGYEGFACPGGVLYMDAHTGQRGLLLAHEFGHQHTLGHTATGVMEPGRYGAPTFTDGEILRAYVDERSDLNTRTGATPPAERRDCTLRFDATPCLDTGYRLPG